MKKIICVLLAVAIVASLACFSVGAVNDESDYSKMTSGGQYNPSDSYTVDENTPTCEEAILACGGDLDDTQTIYFQLPMEDESTPERNWTNQFNILPGTDYCQVCVYWWSGTGSSWPNGEGVKWVGYRAFLEDPVNRIYRATMPYEGSPLVVWNNGVNGGMPADNKPSFLYARQLANVNVEGIYDDEAEPDDSLPEGTPDPDSADGCISIIDYSKSEINPLTNIPSYGSNLYVYYGNGCYGRYAKTSANYKSVQLNDVNPEHHHCDVDLNGKVEAVDATALQRHLAQIDILGDDNLKLGDPDADKVVSIMDATRIQRYLAEMCNIDGSKPYSAAANAYLDTQF